MKKLFTTLLLVIFVSHIQAQIGGLSPRYVNASTADPVAAKTIEFEPSFIVSAYNSEFSNTNKVINLDTLQFENELGFRFSYGLCNRFEMGMFVPSSVDYLNYGLKYNLIAHDKFFMAVIGGINFDFSIPKFVQQSAIGMAFDFLHNDKFISDANLQFSHDWASKNSFNVHFYVDNAFEMEYFSLIAGIYYNRYFADGNISENLAFSPAIMFTAENFYATFYFPFNIYGRNDINYRSLGFALTLPIE